MIDDILQLLQSLLMQATLHWMHQIHCIAIVLLSMLVCIGVYCQHGQSYTTEKPSLIVLFTKISDYSSRCSQLGSACFTVPDLWAEVDLLCHQSQVFFHCIPSSFSSPSLGSVSTCQYVHSNYHFYPTFSSFSYRTNINFQNVPGSISWILCRLSQHNHFAWFLDTIWNNVSTTMTSASVHQFFWVRNQSLSENEKINEIPGLR